MLRNLLSKSAIDAVTTNVWNISINPVCVQSVRWRRKPRWLPTAKSKLFKVNPRHELPKEEEKEWMRLNNNYKLQMNSVRLFLREENARKHLIIQQSMTPADEEAEFQRCKELNDQWNLEAAKVRNARLAEEHAKYREFILGRLEEKKLRDERHLLEIETRVRREKESLKKIITRENIDQAIEEALANPVDYNFSIDMQGNTYKGNERPGDKKATEAPPAIAPETPPATAP